MIAAFCYKTSMRRVEDMDIIVEKFFKLGLVTPDAIDKYIKSKIKKDKCIKELLINLGLTRPVANIDRDFYSTWTDTWKFKPEIIEFAATLAVDKSSPISYMNKVLSSWFEKNITTLADAKKANYTPPNINITKHSYSDADLTAVMKNIESAAQRQKQIAERDTAFFEAYAKDNTLTRAKFNEMYKG